MKRVLMIAFHFPPGLGGSGVQRTLRFVRYLPEFGWQPIVLTAHTRVYPRTALDQMADVPSATPVVRAPGWDAARHFSVGKRYPAFLARPDRWISWWLGAVPAGLHLIRKYRPTALWSTYPIATAHRIGNTLARLSRLPWIADFRDPMAQDGYPTDPAVWQSYARVERASVERARACTFTTPGALREYQARYPARQQQMTLLENGYDEEVFADVPVDDAPLNVGLRTILHSGIVYPSERDPTQLFAALALLRDRQAEIFAQLRIRFRSPVHGNLLHQLATTYGVQSAIEVLPPVEYRAALGEMLRADALLILQAANCNAQVPAKIYEYMRARRPVLALTDPAGDTAQVARDAGISAIAPLDKAEAIAQLLARFVAEPASGSMPDELAIAKASRRGRTEQLARLLDHAVDTRRT